MWKAVILIVCTLGGIAIFSGVAERFRSVVWSSEECRPAERVTDSQRTTNEDAQVTTVTDTPVAVMAMVKPKERELTRAEVIACLNKSPGLKGKEDPAIGMIWYSPAETGIWESGTGLLYVDSYIGVSTSGLCTPRFRVMYSGDSWIFTEKITVMIDGDEVPVRMERTDVDSEVNRGIWEKVDLSGQEPLIRKIAAGKEAYVTLTGEHRRKSWKLSDERISAFKSVVNALNALETLKRIAPATQPNRP